ncbi:metalloprotease TldD [Pseudomonas aeruginosa]|nr:metalloprotease TldD [Pseudomonas aeruginosa]
MSIAVIQMVSQDDVTANLAAARRLLEQAAEGGARLAVLPENFAAMGRRDLAELGRAEARGNGPILPWLNSAARDLRLWIVAGTLPLPPDGQPEAKANACSLLIDEHGERVARYDKLHLFDVDVADARGRYRESDDYAFGQKIVVADTPVGRLGLTVCYDLRFPELYTALREAGAELITAPSAFTAVTGAAHWQVLVRARAIETQCYLLAAGQGGAGIDAADLYFQSQVSESWMLEDGIVKEGSFNLDQGVGVRAQSGEKTGFAYSNAITAEALKQAAVAARSISRAGQNGSVQAFKAVVPARLYAGENPLDVLSRAEKVELLKQIDAATRALDPRIQQVTVSMAGVWEQILVAASDGSLAADIRPLVRFNVSVIVEQNGRRERGGHGGGGRTDYRYFLQEDRAMGYAREALRQALVNLEAIPAPAGTLPVVMGAGWSGVLLHEAVGHGLEGDFNRKGSSAYSGRVGEKVASSLCTIVDDGTLAGRRGSLSVDDEGTPSNCNVLIENGVLKGYMQDKLNARLMGVARTGNGRRESYAHLPMPRMTNTYMLAGESDPQEIIASVEKGIYCANLGGGQVDITSGKFVFSTSEAYLIENGRITTPVKGATLIGNGPEAMSRVSMVGNDLALDSGVGTCGKDGQSVPVGVGQPTLKIDAITVGGTGA